ncbi:hypothetical protein H1R20_g7085, partial [Candolleomyces eurysporus]
MAASVKQYKVIGEELWKGRSEKINAELFALTYGALVVQLIQDYEDYDEVNKQLEKMGYNIGTRLIEDFLARSGMGRCSDFREVGEVIAKVGFKTFLNISPGVVHAPPPSPSVNRQSNPTPSQPSFILTFDENPLAEFVELPEEALEGGLWFSNVLCGVIRGALEMDIGQGFGFRPGSFDGAISISVLQWLLNAETSHPTSSPPHRLTRFFTTLHSALKNPSRAVFQFYPSSDDQIQLITSIAQKAGFGGGIVVDYPNSKKARKVFLCLYVGQQPTQKLPEALDGEEEQDSKVRFERRREREKSRSKSKRKSVKDRDWIIKKKELYRKRGKEGVPNDSKYTGRKRRAVF